MQRKQIKTETKYTNKDTVHSRYNEHGYNEISL